MDENRIEGAARTLGGQVQEAAGRLTGDTGTEAAGKANQIAGQMQGACGQALDEMRSFTTAQPLQALVAALGVGALLGFWLRRS